MVDFYSGNCQFGEYSRTGPQQTLLRDVRVFLSRADQRYLSGVSATQLDDL